MRTYVRFDPGWIAAPPRKTAPIHVVHAYVTRVTLRSAVTARRCRSSIARRVSGGQGHERCGRVTTPPESKTPRSRKRRGGENAKEHTRRRSRHGSKGGRSRVRDDRRGLRTDTRAVA